MGDKLVWQSVKWPDGSRYEGLVKGYRCHLRGVFNYANGDRYLGEYVDNDMDGYGVYVWADGTLYRGQWSGNMMHGCGVKITKQPNGHYIAEEGQFVDDEWAGDVMACTVDQARAAAAEADIAAQMARVFELSPQALPSLPQTTKTAKKTNNTVLLQQKAQAPAEIKAASKSGPVPASTETSSSSVAEIPGLGSMFEGALQGAAAGVEHAVKEVQGAWKNVQQWKPDVKLPQDFKLLSFNRNLTKEEGAAANDGASTKQEKPVKGSKKGKGKVEEGKEPAKPLEVLRQKTKEFHEQRLQPLQQQASDFVSGVVADVKQIKLPQLPQLKKSTA